MNIPDEFGLFPFQRFTADELRHFFVWCAAHKVSDVDLTGGSPVSVSRFGRRVRCSSATLPTTLMSSLIDELFGREVIPRVLAGNPVDRTIQINGDASGRYGLKRGERIRLTGTGKVISPGDISVFHWPHYLKTENTTAFLTLCSTPSRRQ